MASAVVALPRDLRAGSAALDSAHLASVGPLLLARAGDLDPPELETRLVALARAASPLRRGLARVAGRMVAGRGWERLGFARARDYARERAGVSGRQLQELAHMDGAFGGLPQLARAFSRGELSWTKARLLARVATPEDAGRWLARAGGLTARELSREVRAVDTRAHDGLRPETDEEGEDESPEKEAVFVHCTPAVRAKWQRARFLASRMEGHPVPAWMVAERVAAEALSAIPLDEVSAAGLEEEEATCEAPDPVAPANGCAAHALGTEAIGLETAGGSGPAIAAADSADASANGCAAQGDPVDPRLAWLLEGLEEADPFELDARLRRALDGERCLEARTGPALLAVATGRLYRSYGCSSLGEFAREWLGISPRKAEALVRLERAGQIAPAFGAAYQAGRLSWTQAQVLVPLVRKKGSEPWHAAWVAHAEGITVRRLDDEVSRALALGCFEPPPLDPPAGSWDDGRAEEPAEADPQTGARSTTFGRTVSFFFTAPRDVARLFRGALATVQRRIERKNGRTASESEALDAMLEHAFETWQLANAELQREHRVFERDGWRCTGRTGTVFRFSDSPSPSGPAGATAGESENLNTVPDLCVWHHQRGEHAKIVRCRGKAPGELRFDLGLRPGQQPLARYRSGDVLES